jgi:hypothetical protein
MPAQSDPRAQLARWLLDDLQACSSLNPYRQATVAKSKRPQVWAARVEAVRRDTGLELLLRL